MAGAALNTAASLQCPHGGTVQAVTTNSRVKADGAPLTLASDTFTVSGCPFQIPAAVPIPSPCVLIQWILPEVPDKVGGTPTLAQSSAGLCLSAAQVPQGPVAVVNAQTRAKSQR